MKKLLFIYLSLAVLLFSAVGKIAVTKGEVSVIRDGETLSASSGFELLEKDTVITGTGARAQLVFNDETVVSVGKGSEFLVQEYLFDAGGDVEAQKASFKSLKGAFKTITGKIGKVAPEKFSLATKTATIGIRGTHFLGKINIDGDKIACTHGAISVASFAGGAPVVVPAGQITTVLAGAMPTPPRKYTATELGEMNEASGSVTQEEEAQPEAATDEGSDEGTAEGEEGAGTEEAVIVMDEDTAEEVVPVAESIIDTAQDVVSSGGDVVPDVNKLVPDISHDKDPIDLGAPSEQLVEELKEVVSGAAYPMTYIAASGPMDLYGKSLESSIGTPDCKNSDCSLSSSTTWVDYFYYSAHQFYRDGVDVAANEDGTGENLGVGSEVIVQPALTGIQSFFAAIEGTYTDAQGTLGEGDDITGVQMMTTAAGNYEGYNAEYRLETNDPTDTDVWQEHNYLAYDNLGEFIIVTSETTDPSTYGEMYRNSLYMGKKSSWDELLAADTPDHLIYKMLMVNSISYDGSSYFSSYMYNGLASGTDYSDSRVIGNTNNGNVLYISRPQNDGRGWGIILGTAAQGTNNEILFDGNLHVWADGVKDSSGYYTLYGGVDTEVEGELYGSELQGFGMSISSTTPSVFDETVLSTQTNPTAFNTSLLAGYRTDDAGEINLDTPLTGTATMSGFTASKIFVEGSGSESLGYIGLSLDRDSGSITGSIKMGEDLSLPDYTLTINGTGASTSAFISDDYFASVLTGATDYYGTALTPDFASNSAGGFMATNPGFALDDVTWGYWVASYDSALTQFHHKSTWVAGIDTPSSKLDELIAAAGGVAGVEVMTYEGKILGRVNGHGPSGNINSDASYVHIAVDFGSSTPLSGSMAFTVIEYPELVWYVDIGSSGTNTLSDQGSGAMVALLTGNSNSIVGIRDPGGATEAGGLHADLYGADGTAIGGNFYVSGTIDGYNYLTALGVFKGATDQTLTAPVVGSQKILVGSQMSTWLDNPTGTDDSWREASKTAGTMGGYMDSSAFYIALDGDTGTYRSYGDYSYSSTYDGTQFVANTPEYEDGESGSLTLGTVTAQSETTMTNAIGSYASVSAEDLSDGTTDKFVIYDNLKEFFIVLESSNLDASSEAYRSLLFAGTPYAGMTGETDTLLGYNWVASVDRTFTTGELSSGAGAPLLSGGGITYTGATTVINKNTGVVVYIGKPGTDSYGTYLDGGIGSFSETYGSVSGTSISVNSDSTGSGTEMGYIGGELYGSANQGLGAYFYGNYNSTTSTYEDVTAVAGVRVDTPNGVALNPTTDTDGSTGSVNWVGNLAGVRNAASGDAFEHGIITGLTIDRTNGTVDVTNSTPMLTLGLVSGGVVTTPSEYIDISSTYSAYASDDYIVMGLDAAFYGTSFSAADGGGVMVTSPDGVEDDYASWGYWGASFGDPTTTGFEFVPISTWVAGQVASSTVMTALETQGTSMSFSGHVLGYVSTFNNTTSQFENFQAIDTVNSTVSLSVDFGTTNPISGNITFSPTADSALVWSMDVGTNTITAANASFDVSSFTTGSGSTVAVSNSEMHGNFYSDGSSVTSLGGSFASAGLYGSSVVSANGVVKATKNP